MERIFSTRILGGATFCLCLMSAMDALAGEISWESSYRRAQQRSVQSGRPLVVYVGADYCGYCRKMERGAWADKSVARLVASGAVPVKVDAQQESALVRQLRVRSLPTVVVVAPSGKLLGRHDGYLDARGMLAFLQRFTIDDRAQTALAR